MSRRAVAIVGRPNVGKSTLFNRLVERRQAIEDKLSGVTRDRIYGRVEWSGREFSLIDTGGLTFSREGTLKKEVQRQVQFAIEEAAVILFAVDCREEVTPLDQEVASYLRKQGKKVILVANKVDPGNKDWSCYSFYQLGVGDPLPVSASHGLGIGELLDEILAALPQEDESYGAGELVKVAVVGRPNVGKSRLINTLVQKERAIVSEIPGTTRDNVDVVWDTGDSQIFLIDTAGIRKKSKVKEAVEYYSVVRSLKAVDRADVAVVVIDATRGVTEQDQKIAGYVNDAGKGLILAVNKWDLMRKDSSVDDFRQKVTQQLSFVSYAPIIFISALTGWKIHRLKDRILKIEAESRKRITTSILNELLQDALLVNPPPSRDGRKTRFFYATQPETKPPAFVFFVNSPELVHFSYVRYLENRLREAFGFEGVPLRLKIKKKDNT